MAGRPAIVSQTEIKRTLSAAIGAGLRVGKVEIDHRAGKVTIYPEGAVLEATTNPCDRLLR